MSELSEPVTSKVAVVYHHWPLYRLPIAKALCRNKVSGREYTLFSSDVTHPASIVGIDPAMAGVSVADGGLRWRMLKNIWLGQTILWQRGAIGLGFRQEFDAIIFLGNMFYISTWLSAFIARISGKKVFFWTHGYRRHEKGMRGFLRRRFYSLAHGFFLYGDGAKALMVDMGFDVEKLHVIYNSLDVDTQRTVRESVAENQLREIKQRYFASPSLPCLVFIGRLIPSKKLSMLLESVSRLVQDGTLVNVMFVGDGPDTEELQAKAAALKLNEHVAFVGAVYGEAEIGPLLMAADLCVSPGFVGLTAMHSMIYGTPVITHGNPGTQSPEFEAIVDGVTGAFFKQNNVEDLTRVLSVWLQGDTPRAEIRALCIKMIEERYTPDVQLARINAALDSCRVGA